MELIVRDGKWFTVGDSGAGLYAYKRNDIIFNHRQTEELFKNGKVTSGGGRGKMFANGTAFSSGTGKIRGKGTVVTTPTEEVVITPTETPVTSHEPVKYEYTPRDVEHTQISKTPTSSSSSSDKSSTSKAEEIKYETIDFVEMLLDRVERGINKLKKQADSIFASLSIRNKSLRKEMEKVSEAIDSNLTASSTYLAYAEGIGLSESLKSKVRNGSYNINDYDDETAERIKNFETWYNKYLDCIDAAEEYESTLKELYKQEFDTVVADWTSQLEEFAHAADRTSSQIQQRTEKASEYVLTKNAIDASRKNIEDYNAIIKNERTQLQKRNRELKELNEYLEQGVFDGTFSKGSEAYYEMLSQIQDVENEIDTLNEDIIKNTNQIAGSYKEVFDSTKKQFDNVLELAGKLSEQYSTSMDIATAKGLMASTRYYELMLNQEQQNLIELRKQLNEMTTALNNGVNSGAIQKGSEAWYEMTETIADVNNAIGEATKSVIEYNNQIRQIEWERFDYLQDRISDITSESKFLIDLMSHSELFDERGQFTNNGLSTLGLYAIDYNTYMHQADEYAEAIKELNEQLEKDPANTDLLDRRRELLELQRDSIQAAENEKQAIKSLVKEGIDKELSSLKDLISSYTESLDSQKDLYDYQKNISSQAKDIAKLQKTLAAYQNDVTEETQAKIQKLKIELEESQESLRETEYENHINQQKKILDNMYDDYESLVNERLDNLDELVSDMIDMTNNNALVISDTIRDETSKVGYSVTNELSTAVGMNTKSIGNLVTTYGDSFSDKITATNNALNSINNNVAILINASNMNAQSQKVLTPNNPLTSFASGAKSISGGYAWTNENWDKGSAEMILRKSDHAILTPLSNSSRIYNAMASENIWRIANNPSQFIINGIMSAMQSRISGGAESVGNVSQNNQVTINLEGVQDCDSLISEMKNNQKFVRFIHSITLDPINGKSINRKNRF